MAEIGKVLMIAGLLMALLGLIAWFGGGKGWFHWVGRLPGDIRTGHENVRFYFPLITCLVISVVLTLILTVISWFSRK